MAFFLNRAWLTLGAAVVRLEAVGIHATPDDVLHMVALEKVRGYIRLSSSVTIAATKLTFSGTSDDPKLDMVRCGGSVLDSLLPLTPSDAWLLETRTSIRIRSIRQDENDPLEPVAHQDPGARWKPLREIFATKEEIVVLAEDLEKLKITILNPPATLPPPEETPSDTPLATRERNSLLAIIGLLTEMSSLDLRTISKSAAVIENAASMKGVKLSRRTIEEHFKKVSSALEHLSR